MLRKSNSRRETSCFLPSKYRRKLPRISFLGVFACRARVALGDNHQVFLHLNTEGNSVEFFFFEFLEKKIVKIFIIFSSDIDPKSCFRHEAKLSAPETTLDIKQWKYTHFHFLTHSSQGGAPRATLHLHYLTSFSGEGFCGFWVFWRFWVFFVFLLFLVFWKFFGFLSFFWFLLFLCFFVFSNVFECFLF